MARCLVVSFIISLVSLVVIFLWTRDSNTISGYVSLALLLEGGLSLVIGGVVASFSHVIGKASEGVFHSEPWDAKRQKEAETQARTWIATGIFLVLAGFLASAF